MVFKVRRGPYLEPVVMLDEDFPLEKNESMDYQSEMSLIGSHMVPKNHPNLEKPITGQDANRENNVIAEFNSTIAERMHKYLKQVVVESKVRKPKKENKLEEEHKANSENKQNTGKVPLAENKPNADSQSNVKNKLNVESGKHESSARAENNPNSENKLHGENKHQEEVEHSLILVHLKEPTISAVSDDGLEYEIIQAVYVDKLPYPFNITDINDGPKTEEAMAGLEYDPKKTYKMAINGQDVQMTEEEIKEVI